jgi:hypothetical protein
MPSVNRKNIRPWAKPLAPMWLECRPINHVPRPDNIQIVGIAGRDALGYAYNDSVPRISSGAELVIRCA